MLKFNLKPQPLGGYNKKILISELGQIVSPPIPPTQLGEITLVDPLDLESLQVNSKSIFNQIIGEIPLIDNFSAKMTVKKYPHFVVTIEISYIFCVSSMLIPFIQ